MENRHDEVDLVGSEWGESCEALGDESGDPMECEICAGLNEFLVVGGA